MYSWNDGSTFEGQFVDGKPYGMGKITEYKSGRTHEGLFENTDKKIDSVYGPDYYIINKETEQGNKYLLEACKDGRSYYRRRVLAKGGDHLNTYNLRPKTKVKREPVFGTKEIKQQTTQL